MMTLAIGRNKGFTLVEVIISIGILSFGLILVLQGFAQSLNAINISHKNLHASLLADEMIAQYLIDSDNAESVSLDSKNGKIEFENAVYDWGIETKQDEEQAELNELHATVSWVSGKRKGKVSVFTYLRVRLDDEED